VIRQLLAGVVVVESIGRDDVAEMNLAAAAGADPTYREAARLELLHERHERVHRCGCPHVRRDGHGDPKGAAVGDREGAEF
jgi:hypothetical protein